MGCRNRVACPAWGAAGWGLGAACTCFDNACASLVIGGCVAAAWVALKLDRQLNEIADRIEAIAGQSKGQMSFEAWVKMFKAFNPSLRVPSVELEGR